MNGDRTDGGMEGEEGRGFVCIDPDAPTPGYVRAVRECGFRKSHGQVR